MKTTILFEKYELNENGEVKNLNTGNLLSVKEKANGKYVKLNVDGKTKEVNITKLMEEHFTADNEVYINETIQNEEGDVNMEITNVNETVVNEEIIDQEVVNEEIVNNEETDKIPPLDQPIANETTPEPRTQARKMVIKVTELDGTVHEFKTFKLANEHFGLRKDYLNYCLKEKYAYLLTKGELKLKSVEKVEATQVEEKPLPPTEPIIAE